ncbi:MAG: pyridoxamine 5'-phosphate oxidase family protein [Candidatus Cloacimonetes bacterium]|nr:pyridoxamine 5'-phosphate oxidase family protein [Candidatus Cloacimonadota bacterium]
MKYWDILNKTQPVAVASVEGDQPRLRMMTLIMLENRLFLATGSKDAKTRQWAQNPKLECMYLLSDERGNGYLRITGTVRRVGSVPLKHSVAEHARFIYQYWQDADSPDYVLYEIEVSQWRYLKPGVDTEEVYS